MGTRVKTLAQIESRHGDPFPPGTDGVIMEVLGPDCWLIELRSPNDALIGDASYETVELTAEEFRVVAK